MLERHKLEVGRLHSGPDQPVLAQSVEVCAPQLLPGILSRHDGHTGQEDGQVTAGEDDLVGGDAGEDLEVGAAGELDLALQETEPFGGGGTEDAAAVEGHAGGAAEFVVGEAFLLDALLGHGVAGGEEDGGGEGLGEHGAPLQGGLVAVVGGIAVSGGMMDDG